MKNIDDIVVVINARLNSSRVKEKMIRDFANTNLLELAIKKIINSEIIPKKNDNNNLVFNTKFVKETYQASHSMYIGLLEDLCKGVWFGSFKKDDPELFFVDEEEALDIDYEWEFDMCEAYYKSKFIK